MKYLNSSIWLLPCCALALLFLSAFGCVAASESPAGTVAIKGYDTVAYFTDGKALKGNESFSYTWHNMTWYFLNSEHRDLFVASPEEYAPQFDGYCAWAMTESRKAVTNPEVWRIVDGKLYLNCSEAAYEKWRKDIPGNIKKANENWLKLNSPNQQEK
ncbi:MAG: YHS domain-containing (seleno)protein [Geobacteraceae bacterium]